MGLLKVTQPLGARFRIPARAPWLESPGLSTIPPLFTPESKSPWVCDSLLENEVQCHSWCLSTSSPVEVPSFPLSTRGSFHFSKFTSKLPPLWSLSRPSSIQPPSPGKQWKIIFQKTSRSWTYPISMPRAACQGTDVIGMSKNPFKSRVQSFSWHTEVAPRRTQGFLGVEHFLLSQLQLLPSGSERDCFHVQTLVYTTCQKRK